MRPQYCGSSELYLFEKRERKAVSRQVVHLIIVISLVIRVVFSLFISLGDHTAVLIPGLACIAVVCYTIQIHFGFGGVREVDCTGV